MIQKINFFNDSQKSGFFEIQLFCPLKFKFLNHKKYFFSIQVVQSLHVRILYRGVFWCRDMTENLIFSKFREFSLFYIENFMSLNENFRYTEVIWSQFTFENLFFFRNTVFPPLNGKFQNRKKCFFGTLAQSPNVRIHYSGAVWSRVMFENLNFFFFFKFRDFSDFFISKFQIVFEYSFFVSNFVRNYV